MFIDGYEELELESFEYCFLTTKTHHSSGSFDMHIPKLMPLIPRAEKNTTTFPINNTMFVNDAACKPQAAKSVATQNFLTVPRFQNTDFLFKADKLGYIHFGARFLGSFINKNYRDRHLTDSI